MAKSFEERFWDKVDKAEGCWQWMASKDRGGYGRIWLNQTSRLAHRISYEWAHGLIPEGMYLDHMCHNRACVNPDHMRVVTQKQNMENRSVFNGASGVRGVIWEARKSRWRTRVKHNGKVISAGLFADINDAEAAVIALRNELFTHNDQDRRAA